MELEAADRDGNVATAVIVTIRLVVGLTSVEGPCRVRSSTGMPAQNGNEPRERAVSIRPAKGDDAAAISDLHAGCFVDLFAGLLGDYIPPREDRLERERSWTGPIGRPRDRHALLVAERRGRVIGFVAVGPSRDADDKDRTTGELRTVMVDAAARGSGAGPALIAAGEGAMTACGFAVAILWVLPENRRAVRAYERRGWSRDGGERVLDVGGRAVRAVRYRKLLAPRNETDGPRVMA